MNGDGQITLKELQVGFSSMIKDWKTLKRSWSGHETVSRAFHISTLVVYCLMSFVLWMVVFSVSPQKVLLPLVRILLLLLTGSFKLVCAICRALLRWQQRMLLEALCPSLCKRWCLSWSSVRTRCVLSIAIVFLFFNMGFPQVGDKVIVEGVQADSSMVVVDISGEKRAHIN